MKNTFLPTFDGQKVLKFTSMEKKKNFDRKIIITIDFIKVVKAERNTKNTRAQFIAH